MLSQPVWDQMLESEKKKVQLLEESYAEKMRAASVSVCLLCVAELHSSTEHVMSGIRN